MNQPTSTARVALKWGLITGITLIVYTTILYTLNLTTNGGLSIVIYGILIGGLVLGMRDYRTANDGYMTYSEGLGLGALLSAVAGFLSASFTVFYTQFIDTDFQARLAEQMREQLEEKNLSDEQIDQSIELVQKMQTPGLQFIFGLLGTILIGVVFSLAIAAFIRRNKANPFE